MQTSKTASITPTGSYKRKTQKHKDRYDAPTSVNNKFGFKDFTLSDSQKKCLTVIENNIITFVQGRAGTGKTMIALHYAVQQYLKEYSQRIIVIRTPVEANSTDKIGYLPSELKDKIEPHFVSAKTILEDLLNKDKVDADLNGPHKRIQFLIPNFALGVTWDNATIIIDEAQMMQPLIMKLLLERIGVNSKVIVLGDPSQLYNADAKRQGMADAIQKFFIKEEDKHVAKYPDIGYFEFSIDDCMRSDIVKTVLEAYS